MIRRTRKIDPMAGHYPAWNRGEEIQWWRYFVGYRPTAPEGRTIAAARKRLKPHTYRKLDSSQLHMMATAAAQFLPRVPYKGPSTHTKFVEDVQRLAVYPEGLPRKTWPADVFSEAVIAARRALYDLSPLGNVGPVDNANATR